MKKFFLLAGLCLMNPAVWAADAPSAVTSTVKIAGIEVANEQILITPKTGYVHLLWDAFPNRAAIQAAGKAFSLETAVRDLAGGPGLSAKPDARIFKVDIVEFFEKDSYGYNRWDKVKFLGRFEVVLTGKKWVVKKRAG